MSNLTDWIKIAKANKALRKEIGITKADIKHISSLLEDGKRLDTIELDMQESFDLLADAVASIRKMKGPKGEKGEQGLQGIQGIQGKDGLDGLPGKDGNTIKATVIRDKLETLRGSERLDAKAIKNLPIMITQTITKASQSSLVTSVDGQTGAVDLSGTYATISSLTGYVTLTPTTTTRNLITVPTATAKALVLKSTDNSTTNAIFEVQSSTTTITKLKSIILGSSSSDNFLNITGTLPTTLSDVTDGVRIDITGAGSSSQLNGALRVVYNAGYTGSTGTTGIAVTNAANGIGTGLNSANFGQNTNVVNSTTGYNVANRNLASGSSTVNVGNASRAQVDTAGDNIAIMGVARNTTGDEIAGFFRLTSASNTTAFPSGVSGALVADNGSTTRASLIVQDNATSVLDVIDGGNTRLLLDSQLLVFGAGQDATITYDGTNMIINPKLVGTGYLGVSGTVQVDLDINLAKETSHDIQILDSTTSNTGGGALSVKSGAGVGTGNGGPLMFEAGQSGNGATGDGGALTFTGGNANSTNGNGGNVNFYPGAGAGSGTDGLFVFVDPTTGNEATIATSSLTGNRAFLLPDTAGTFALTSDFASGVYSPTRSAEANLDSNVTMSEAQYMRVGNTVTVSGRFTADPTLAATATSFEITLPVASNIGAVEDLAGTAFCGAIASQGAAILGSVANNTAVFQWVSGDITSQSWSYTFSYQVI